MSEKKTTSKKVHTLTLEDQTKLAQANVKKMEQGKIEVMKVVEGVQGAEKLAELIERGKKNGKLSSSELMDVLENLDLESDQMDKIYDTLENLGIDTVGDDYLPELADDIMPPPWRSSTRLRSSPRRRWWIPIRWWTPSASTTLCGCTLRRSAR